MPGYSLDSSLSLCCRPLTCEEEAAAIVEALHRGPSRGFWELDECRTNYCIPNQIGFFSMAGLHMDCVEFDRIGAEDETEEEEGVEVQHVRLSETEAHDLLHEGDIDGNENQEVVEGEVKFEGENDLHMAVIVRSEDGLTLDPAMLASGATQLVQLGSSPRESLSLLTDDSQFLSGQLIQLSDGTTAVVQRGFQVVQLSDGTSALLPSGLFTDGEMDGTQLSLEQIGDQMEEDEDEDQKNHVFARQTVHLHGDIVDPDMVSGNGCLSAGDMSVGGEESVMGQLANAGGRMSIAKTFKCSFDRCGRQYTTHHHLKVHMRSHTGDRPYPCDFEGCSKAFATGYGLKSHRRIHTGEKPYRCVNELCDKAFKTSGDLQKHMRTHTGERPFMCPYEGCKRSFTTSNILKVHIRTHTGERPFTCTEKGCGKTFASATNYKNHIRIHSGEKPYECSVAGCGKRFTEYSSLYKHHVVHTHTKPYPCETCGKTYRQTSTLAMHKRMAHGEDLGDDGDYVRVLVQNSTTKQPSTFRLATEDGPRGPDDTDGNLVIDTSDTHQVSLAGASSNLLQQLPSTISLDGTGSGSHVFVITDPSQIEAIQRISNQGN